MTTTKRFLLGLAVLTIMLSAISVAIPQTASAGITGIIGSAEATVSTPSDMKSILLSVCEDDGYSESCAKDLLGMVWKETRGDGKAIGDSGRARGYFQIHYKMHKISIACAEDLRCSAEWTLNYLEKNSYAKYPKYAVQCHNSCNVQNGYASSAMRYGKWLWTDGAKHLALATTRDNKN